ncbi:uncharacterized protein J7T54_007463 [Emericellopsis cladophorae]|uniref:HTH APSES-type domain-containing protein n=1 Tax=Emericellopsis cladophorae TaxID=2686198 RepID=A0A9P9XTG2_9HYPO|nr:uncharacterized protein J7T54_007463 [Emericellopsis cladophorae]KAI6777613.1 hypothetical protein J7T54_007463 [Emericellopsis cladophorae]
MYILQRARRLTAGWELLSLEFDHELFARALSLGSATKGSAEAYVVPRDAYIGVPSFSRIIKEHSEVDVVAQTEMMLDQGVNAGYRRLDLSVKGRLRGYMLGRQNDVGVGIDHGIVCDRSELISRRRYASAVLMDGLLTGNDKNDGSCVTADYVHMPVPLPKGIVSALFRSNPSPSCYFLLRRTSDGYISAMGLFKATFPYAKVADEEAERAYIKSLPSTSLDETDGAPWIPEEQALQLAAEYNITPWIQALLDDTPIHPDIGPVLGPVAVSGPRRSKSSLEPQIPPSRSSRLRRIESPPDSHVAESSEASASP